ncbi:MAG: hypothetical protein WEE89_00630, partial [Gemmatimonadota bacterium]
RARAIAAYRKALVFWPADTLVAGPLVRYLIEDDQRTSALEASETFAAASTHPGWPHFLRGFALHAAERYEAAEQAFERALATLSASQREDWLDVRVLLAPEERSRYRQLPTEQRSTFQQRLWQLADPIHLTRGNESRAEHFSRHVYGRILRRAPFTSGAVSWGADVEELTLRFGVPRMRTQDWARGPTLDAQITEHFDPDQQSYVPPALLTAAGITEFAPGAGWPYDTIRSRNGFAPRSVRRMLTLDHMLSRFYERDSVIVRVDAQLPLDSAVRYPTRFEFGVFLLDSTFQVIAARVDTIAADSARTAANLVLPLPAGAAAYSVEARDLGSRLAGRSRHRLPAPLPASRPLLSDLVLLAPAAELPASRENASFTPVRSLQLKRGQPVVIYLEADGLTPGDDRMVRYAVDLEVMEETRPGVFTRTVQRLGRALGLGGNDVSPRITWNEQKPAAIALPIALNLGKLQLNQGLQRFRVTVTDRETGVRSSVDRTVRIEGK